MYAAIIYNKYNTTQRFYVKIYSKINQEYVYNYPETRILQTIHRNTSKIWKCFLGSILKLVHMYIKFIQWKDMLIIRVNHAFQFHYQI